MFGFPFRRNWGIAKFRPPFPYTLEEPIGHGGLSRAVYKVTDESSEETYAVKAIPVISGTPDAELRKHLHEFKTIVKLSARPHRNVVQYYYFDVARWDAGPEVRLFMEYCNGHNLAGRNESLAASKQRLKEHDIVRDLKDILRGLQYLHRNGIVHLDIKGGNILITTTGVVKLADFGLITKIQGAVTASGEVNGAAGTTVYMAPERFSGVFGRCGRASDVWSVGCVLLEMLHGHAPRFYRRESRGKMMLMVRLPEIEAALATGEKPCYFHPGSKEDPQKLGRKGCHDSKEFLRTGKDFLDSCFRLTAADRPTAAALLQHPLLTGRDLQEYHQKVEVPLTSAAIGAEPRWRGMLQWIAQSLLPKNPPSGLAPLCTGCRRIQQVNSDIFHWLVRSPDSKYCASCWAKVRKHYVGSRKTSDLHIASCADFLRLPLSNSASAQQKQKPAKCFARVTHGETFAAHCAGCARVQRSDADPFYHKAEDPLTKYCRTCWNHMCNSHLLCCACCGRRQRPNGERVHWWMDGSNKAYCTVCWWPFKTVAPAVCTGCGRRQLANEEGFHWSSHVPRNKYCPSCWNQIKKRKAFSCTCIQAQDPGGDRMRSQRFNADPSYCQKCWPIRK